VAGFLLTSPLLHLQHKVIRVIGQDLDLPLRVDPTGVLDAHAQAFFGVIQPGLGGEDHTRFEDIVIGGGETRPGPLVDVQTDAMAERVDVAFHRRGGVERGLMSTFLEQFTGQLLVILEAGVQVEFALQPVVNRLNLVVE